MLCHFASLKMKEREDLDARVLHFITQEGHWQFNRVTAYLKTLKDTDCLELGPVFSSVFPGTDYVVKKLFNHVSQMLPKQDRVVFFSYPSGIFSLHLIQRYLTVFPDLFA